MTQATPVRDLSLSQLASVFNSMPGKPVNKFSSRADAERRVLTRLGECGRMIIRDVTGFYAVPDPEDERNKSRFVQPESLIVEETTGGPGRARLTADPAAAEALRQAVVADQAKAATAASQARILPQTNGGLTGADRARDRAPPVSEDDPVQVRKGQWASKNTMDAAVIKVLVSNPKREGSKAHARFALYRTGMTVAEYRAAVGDATNARADLAWDVRHKFITIG
jgi:hypothetical protein